MASLPLVALSMSACIIDGAFDDDEDSIFDDDDDGFDDDDSSPPPSADTGDHEQPCPVGFAGCPCTGQNVCDPGLECIDSIHTCVVPDPCAIGDAGCACTAAGTCDPGFICKEEVCVSEMPCHAEDTGTEGCQCTSGGGCDPGLSCFSDICVNYPAGGSSGEGAASESGSADSSTSA